MTKADGLRIAYIYERFLDQSKNMKRCADCGADIEDADACPNCLEETARSADAVDASGIDTQQLGESTSPLIRIIGGILRFVGMFVIAVGLVSGCAESLVSSFDSKSMLMVLVGAAMHFGGRKMMPPGAVGVAASTSGAIAGTLVAIGLIVAFVGMLIYALSVMVGA